jgi:uncharacterized protein
VSLIRDIEDFRALDPFFRVIEQGLQGLADGDHFFELLADDVVFHFITTSSVVLEYASQGKVVATGYPYSNRYISVITLKDRKVSHWRDYLDPLRVFAALEGRGIPTLRP